MSVNVGKAIGNIFGTKHEREVRRMLPLVHRINQIEPQYRKMSDFKLRDQTRRFRARLARGETLDDLLPEAFAVVREAAQRVLGMRPYDVQLIGGIALHEGKIAEMKTGEGKTLVATLPMYLNALTGLGCHLVTVNDYLAKRDAEWMGRIYRFLGMTVGVIVHGMTDKQRQRAYRADITYGTNNEFGFDYLRDNMKDSIEQYVHKLLPEEERGPKNSLFHYAIVDEVDSILIDEARTPLIISGPAEEAADLYLRVNEVVRTLKRDVDYVVDLKAHSVSLTDQGVERVERKLGIDNLYDPRNLDWLHHVNQALTAHTLYKRDVQYLVENGKVVIIDEFTGRKMEGRRWSDGLHQAIEAKEGLKPEEENQTLATVTFQNYFKMYRKLSGMTGTAETEAAEFHKIYELDVMVIPTNVPCIRQDYDDVVYKTEEGKLKAVVEEIIDCRKRGQPVLVGTVAVEKTEEISRRLKRLKIPHEVLNAKNHEREAFIVAQAGRKGSVTISTNMAGRGTDIILGGNAEFVAKLEADPDTEPDRYKEVLERYKKEFAKERAEVHEAGGLHILGTERHESRRIDNQLRGRAGRQGDPGSSRFYLSLEDDLMKIFGGERLHRIMEWANMPEDMPIEHSWINKSIERAQRQVEAQNFDIRKNLFEYDNVMNHQRNATYALRRQVLEGKYVPELSESERRAGKKALAPTVSGKWTLDLLSDKVRPWIAKLVLQEYAKAAKTHDEATGMPNLPEPEHLTHLLYRYFGAKVDLEQEIDDEMLCAEKATREIASSLIQQRERLLDMAYELASKQVMTFCPEGRHSDDWDTYALEDAVLHIFDIHVDGLEWLARLAEIQAAIKNIVPVQDRKVSIETLDEMVKEMVEVFCPADMEPEQWDLRGLARDAGKRFGVKRVEIGEVFSQQDAADELKEIALSRCEPGQCRHKIQEEVGKIAARLRQYGNDLLGEDFKDWFKERLDELCPKDDSVALWDLDALVSDVRARITRPDDGLTKLTDREAMVERIYDGVERFIAMADQDDDLEISLEALPRWMSQHCPAWNVEELNETLNGSLGHKILIEEKATRSEILDMVHDQLAKVLPRKEILAHLTSVAAEEVSDQLGVDPPSNLAEEIERLFGEFCPAEKTLNEWDVSGFARAVVVLLGGSEDGEDLDMAAGDPLKALVPVKGRYVPLERVRSIVDRLTDRFVPSETPAMSWDLSALGEEIHRAFFVKMPQLTGTLDQASFLERLEHADPDHAAEIRAAIGDFCPADKAIQAWDVPGLLEKAKEAGWAIESEAWVGHQQGIFTKVRKRISQAMVKRRNWSLPENLPALLAEVVEEFWPAEKEEDPKSFDTEGLVDALEEIFCERFEDLKAFTSRRELKKRLLGLALERIAGMDKAMSLERRLWVFRHLYLEEIDDQWIEHLKAMDHLREGIGLRGYAQRDPKLEYQREGFDMFYAMMQRVKENVASKVFRVRIEEDDEEALPEFEHKRRRMMFLHAGAGAEGGGGGPQPQQARRQGTVRRQVRKVRPNEPCPCGSGKKYKNCHMRKDIEAARKGELPEWAALARATKSAKARNQAER